MISFLIIGCLFTTSVLSPSDMDIHGTIRHGYTWCDEGQKEVNLFHQVDVNNDDQLTRSELDAIFLLFDTNNDKKVTPTEFVNDWQTFNLGGPQDAQTLFTRADTNDDGFIDANDIPAIFAFFDQNGSGLVDISEFLTQWAALQEEPTDESNVSVDITG